MKIKKSAFLCLIVSSYTLLLSNVYAETAITTDKQKFSYAVGVQIGTNLKRDGFEVDVDVIRQAISDVMSGEKLKVSMEDMQQAVVAYQKAQAEVRQAKGEKAKVAGKEFLEKNKKAKGVQELESGIQYQVITEGKGQKPQATDTIVAHYRGTLIDGKEFDSSYSRGQPATFPINQVIKGWQEILPKMNVGSKWKVFIPSDLAYGERGAGANIGPNETLVFEIELLEIKAPAESKAPAAPAPAAAAAH